MAAVLADALRKCYLRSAVAAAVVWPLLILAVFVPLSVHRFREMNR